MSGIHRKPIITVSNRRNSENHPEFLDTEALLLRFEPLIKSIHNKFMSYNNVFFGQEDSNDLYNQIVLEFLRLRKNYDPRRGVDFTGYIKLHLQQRIYHYVMKKQRLVQSEQVASGSSDSGDVINDVNCMLEVVEDTSSIEEFERTDAVNSIPWELLNDEQSELVQHVFVEQKTVEELAKIRKSTIKSVKIQMDEVCELLIENYKLNVLDKRLTN